MKKRIVITGVGVIAPNGIGKDNLWNSLINNKSGIDKITKFNAINFKSKICAEVMIPTIKKYLLEKNKNLKHVGIILTELPDYKDFENVINSYSN